MNSSVAVPTNEVEADLNDKGVRIEGEQVEVIETAAETKTEGRVEEKSIEESSHWFSRALLLYLNPLFEKGARQPLEQSDLGCISQQDDCHQLFMTANTYWEEELKKPMRRLLA